MSTVSDIAAKIGAEVRALIGVPIPLSVGDHELPPVSLEQAIEEIFPDSFDRRLTLNGVATSMMDVFIDGQHRTSAEMVEQSIFIFYEEVLHMLAGTSASGFCVLQENVSRAIAEFDSENTWLFKFFEDRFGEGELARTIDGRIGS